MKTIRVLIAGAAMLTLAACGNGGQEARDLSEADTDYQTVLLERLIDAQPGDVIEIPAGVYSFDRSLSLNVDGVTIRGAGMDETILSFQDQMAGAEGLIVTADDFTLEDLAIEDTSGDGLKVNGGENIIIRGVRVEWTDGYSTDNGAYGIYPVQTTNVLVENTVAIGASDAGIYVGQSRNVVVRNSRAEYNVAGIEIENCIGADVYGNVATNNTGGILVFNMPNLPQPGYHTRVYDNEVFANNTENFGHEGTPVASVPAGSGIVINSNDRVEIFNNRIADNDTANIIISSLYSTGYSGSSSQEDFDAYPETIWIHDNTYEGGGSSPDGMDLTALKIAMFGLNGALPDILFDGYIDSGKMVDGALPDELRICVDDPVDVLNADGPNNYGSPSVDTDAFRCTHEGLAPVELALAE